MRIQSDPGYVLPNLYSSSRNGNHPKIDTGSSHELIHYDTLDLRSVVPRHLPVDAIQHETPKFFFNTEINASLDKVLSGKAPEVSKAAYHIIEANIFATNSDRSDEDRALLLEAGLAQARYLADHYMNDSESAEFLDTMNLLAAVAKTRKVDPATGRVSFVELPQKPQGAPSDYVNPQKLMQRFDPKAYADLQATVKTGGNTGGVLIEFVKKMRLHPEWAQDYRKEQESLMAGLRNTKIENRFESVQTTNMEAFVNQMKEKAEQVSPQNIELLASNVAYFAHLLGK